MIRFARIAMVGAVLGFSAGAVSAQSSDPAWLDTLSSQLAADQGCAVEYFVNTKEGELGGRKTFEARAQCRDGRQFDASLVEPAKTFTIKECGVQVC